MRSMNIFLLHHTRSGDACRVSMRSMNIFLLHHTRSGDACRVLFAINTGFLDDFYEDL